MSNIFFYLYLISFKIAPISIIVYRHFRVEESWNFPLIIFLLILILFYFTIYKSISDKVKVWEIQDNNMWIVNNFKIIRAIIAVGSLWYMWVILHQDYQLIFDTLFYTVSALFISLVFRNLATAFEKE